MIRAGVSRRGLLQTAALSLIALPAAASGQTAGAAAGMRFRAVAVDVGPLLDHGGGASARLFQDVLLAQLRTVFADRLSPGVAGAPLLTARVTNLFLSDYADRGTNFAFGNNDNIEGDGIVTSAGRVLSSTHILTELPPSYSGSPLLPGIDEARLGAIAYQFAYWLRREMAI